jgi:molecular chaperone DnaJ
MDLYAVLGIERRASAAEVKRAYRRLARRFHPDINPGDQAAAVVFQRIVEAYETLVDPDRRRDYDAHGLTRQSSVDTSVEFEGFDFSRAADGLYASTFSELFAEVFAGPAAGEARRAEAGADLHVTVSLSFDDAVRGCERLLTVTRQAVCAQCHGAGETGTVEVRCPQCQGAGTLRAVRGHMIFSRTCAACGGTGRRQVMACGACAGLGVTSRTESVAVRIPAGVTDGARVRAPEKGHAGRRGGRPGDLYITVQVAPHPFFQRDGDDLKVTVPLAVHEAALGAKIEVPSLDGRARLRIPPGTQSGQCFRLHGRSVPSARDGHPGDLVVEVRLTLPTVLDERSKELLREFGRLNGESVRKDLGM